MERPRFLDVHVLVVDDDDLIRLITTTLLRSLGYANITTADNGEQAVTACEHTSFDLVLMDCDMPVLNGVDATRALRSLGFSAPIIAFTATVTPAQKHKCLQAGMNDFLPKPADVTALGAMVQRWLTRII